VLLASRPYLHLEDSHISAAHDLFLYSDLPCMSGDFILYLQTERDIPLLKIRIHRIFT